VRRIYHPWQSWEDHGAGFYRRSCTPAETDRAFAYIGLPDWLAAMPAVLEAWPLATEHNLTNLEQNRLAWLGQAAACWAVGVPACATAAAWWRLTAEQRHSANGAAAAAIMRWEEGHCRENRLELTF
jgi:hypothetical protein